MTAKWPTLTSPIGALFLQTFFLLQAFLLFNLCIELVHHLEVLLLFGGSPFLGIKFILPFLFGHSLHLFTVVAFLRWPVAFPCLRVALRAFRGHLHLTFP